MYKLHGMHSEMRKRLFDCTITNFAKLDFEITPAFNDECHCHTSVILWC